MASVSEYHFPDKDLCSSVVVAGLMGAIAVVFDKSHIFRVVAACTTKRLPIRCGICSILISQIKGIILGKSILCIPVSVLITEHLLGRLNTERISVTARRTKAADLFTVSQILTVDSA